MHQLSFDLGRMHERNKQLKIFVVELQAKVQSNETDIKRMQEENKQLQYLVGELHGKLQSLEAVNEANQNYFIRIHAGILASAHENVKHEELRKEKWSAFGGHFKNLLLADETKEATVSERQSPTRKLTNILHQRILPTSYTRVDKT